MPGLRFLGRRRGAALALALFASLLSCGREVTGPGGRGALVGLHFAPDYSAMIDEAGALADAISDLVPFTRVRIELRRVDNTVAASEVIDFPSDATEIPLTMTVRLGAAAQDGAEPLMAYLRYINTAGDTVFAGQVAVTAQVPRRGEQPLPVQVPIAPTVPGAIFTRIDIAPDTVIALSGTPTTFTATGYDAQDAVVPNAIIGFLSRNPNIVAVPNVGSGQVTLAGARGSTWVIAQSLTGVKDSAFVQVLPRPASLTKVSGDGQNALAGAAFAQALRVRVLASDGLPVANWPVNFAVTSGGGSVSAAVVNTDAGGFAEVTWTAGAGIGAGSVTASVASPALSTIFAGAQLSAAPTSLAFVTQPGAITAGQSLPNVQVAVRNGAGQTIPDFTGAVTLALTGGTAGASLVGTTTVAAVAGIATFPGLTVNRGGSAYRLTATYETLPPAQSNTFDVAAAPPAAINLLGGGGQVAPPATLLPDSIRVRVVDAFGFPVAGATVQFTVAAGGGTVSAVARVTDADGRAGVTWTLGTGGAQQLRASLGALETFVSASIAAAGGVELVAGFDYTVARIGNPKQIPIYLTNPSASAIEVTLEVDEPGSFFLEWTTPSITINPGVTRVDATVLGLDRGQAWAIMRSSAGDDSVLVQVDSSFLELTNIFQYAFGEGDTIRTFVKLSEPAPAGGVTVVLRSLNPSVAALAPGAGRGVPNEGCIGDLCYGGGSLREGALREAPAAAPNGATASPPTLLDAPADTAAVFIPEGQLVGEYAILLLDDLGGCASVEIVAEAPGFESANQFFTVQRQETYYYLSGGQYPSNGIGVGQMVTPGFYVTVPRTREQRIYFESSDTTRVQVDSFAVVPAGDTYANPTSFRVVGLDTAWVRFWVDGGAPDSLLFVGSAPRIRLYAPSAPEGGLSIVTVSASSELNPFSSFPRATDLVVTLVSGDPGVVVPASATVRIPAGQDDVEADLAGILLGSTFLTAEAAGHAADTVFVGAYTPAVQFNSYSPFVGVNQLYPHFLYVTSDAARSAPRRVTVQSLTPGVIEVVTETVDLMLNAGAGTAVLRGVAPGTGTVRFSGPGLFTTDLTVTVGPTQLQMFTPSTMVPDGEPRAVTSSIVYAGNVRSLADTVTAVLRSTNPSVLEVSDSVLVFPALGPAYVYAGRVRPLTPGTATLWLVRPGVDSVSSTVTVQPFQIRPQLSSSFVGQGMERALTLFREGPDTLALPISVTQSGPGGVSIPQLPVGFEVGSYSIPLTLIGDTPGVDTLTFTVPGYPPVTQVIRVDTTFAAVTTFGDDPHAGSVYPFAATSFRTSGGDFYPTVGRSLRFRVLSLDTAFAIVEQDTVEWTAGNPYEPTRYATIRFRKPGVVQLAVADLDGVLMGETTELYIEPGDLFGSGYYYGSQGGVSIGMNQRTTDFEMFIQRGMVSTEPLWVTLTSTNPGLVQVPDSILIPANELQAYFTITAGDTVGSTQIIASAVGYNPWPIDVLVTRAKFELYRADAFTDGPGTVEVYALDALTENTRPFASAVTARFTTTTPGLIDAAGAAPFVLPVSDSYLEVPSPTPLGVGRATLGVVDDGPARFDSVAAGSGSFSIRTPEVKSGLRRILLTPDLTSNGYDIRALVQSGRDTAVVHLAALGSNFALVDDSLVIGMDGQTSVSREFPLRGLALGRDTLTLAMAGALTDTVVVDVAPGTLAPYGSFGQTVVVGDSALISLVLRDAGGRDAVATTALTFTTSVSDTSFVFLEGGAPASTLTLPTGETILSFWVRAEHLGTATLTLSHPNFRPYQFRLNSVVR
jgi:hypothetical protein